MIEATSEIVEVDETRKVTLKPGAAVALVMFVSTLPSRNAQQLGFFR